MQIPASFAPGFFGALGKESLPSGGNEDQRRSSWRVPISELWADQIDPKKCKKHQESYLLSRLLFYPSLGADYTDNSLSIGLAQSRSIVLLIANMCVMACHCGRREVVHRSSQRLVSTGWTGSKDPCWTKTASQKVAGVPTRVLLFDP